MVSNPEPLGEEERPPWQWMAIGAAGIGVLWTPLAVAIHGITPGQGAATVLGLHLVAFMSACFASGLMVGRFGGSAGRREAAIGGATAAAGVWGLAAWGWPRWTPAAVITWALLLLAILCIGAGAAWLGGTRGVNSRKRSLSPTTWNAS